MSARDLPAGAMLRAVKVAPAPQAFEAQHEHEFEAELGLPEPLPPGERLLWQGAPAWRDLARRGLHLRQLAVYFGVIVVARAVTVLVQGGTVGEAAIAALWLTPLVAVALSLIATLAWLTARTTVYTVTDRRVVMRIGIVLSVTFNLPYRAIDAAGLRSYPDGSGDIPLSLAGSDRIAWLHLWPHARPWRLKRPEPMLRSVPDATRVAGLIADAWSAARQVPVAQPLREAA